MKKCISMLLVLAMLMSSMPAAVFAEGEAAQEETVVVQTVELQAEEPETEEPKAEEPKAEEPKAVEPKADEPKAEEPKAEEPKAEEPKAEEPKAEEPETEEPKAEEPEAEEPKAEEPKVEEPETEEPKAEEPKVEEPETEEPKADEPENEGEPETEDSDGADTEDEAAQEDGVEEGTQLDPSMMDAALLEEGMGSVDAPELLADAINYPTVQALNVAYKDADSITVYWTEVDHPDLIGYRISYSKVDDFNQATREMLSSSDTSYLLYDLKIGDVYYFWIQACYDTGAEPAYSNPRKLKGSVMVCPVEPNDFKATTKSTSSVQLTWSLPSGYSDLSGYIIERDGAELARVGKTSKNYTDNTLELGRTYVYRLYSYKTVNGADIRSECEYAELEYTALPPAPVLKTWDSAGLNSIKLTWSPVGNIDGYNIYRTANPSSTPKLIGTVGKDETSFIDKTNIITGQSYWYCVTAYVGSVESEKSAVAEASAKPPIPQNPKATYVSDTEIKVTWNTAAEDVQGYVVYGSDDNETYSELIETGEVSFTEDGLSVGQMRYYRITSYVKIMGARLESDFSKTAFDITRPLAPEELKATNPAYDEIMLEWTYCEGADGYEIWRSTDGTNFTKVKVIDDGSTLTWTNVDRKCGTTYHYKVRAYVQESTYVGPYSNTVSVTAKPAAPGYVINEPQLNTNSVKVIWEAVEGADGYYIYASENGAPSTLVASQTANSDPERYKTVKNLNLESEYRFFVCAYKTVNGVNVAGPRTESTKELLPMYAPLQLKSTASGLTTMDISWKAMGGVDGYAVYVTCDDDLSYSYSKELTETKLSLKGLTQGYRYTVSVCAYRTIDGQNVYGPEATNAGQVFFTSPDAPTDLKVASNIKQYGINVTWKGVADCDGYVIERSEKQYSDYVVIKTLEGADVSSYLDAVDPAYAGMTLYYRVRSYVDAAGVVGAYGQRAVSEYDDAYTVLTPPRPSKLTATAVDATSVELVWDELDNVDGYQIYYRKTSGTTVSSWSYKSVELGDISYTGSGKPCYTMSGLSTGKKYDFKVRGYVTDGVSTVVGALSPAASATPAPAVPEDLQVVYAGATSVYLDWSPVVGAGGYRIYQSTDNVKYTQVAKSYTTNVEVTGLTCGKTYYFKVCAYKGDIKGLLSDEVKVTTIIGTVPNFRSESVDLDSLKLKWNAASGVKGYQIQIESKSVPGSWSTLIKNATGTSYTVNDLVLGEYRNFRIRAYTYVDGVQKWGEWTYLYDRFAIAAKPTSLTVAYTGQNRVRLSWKYSKGAIGYMVYAQNMDNDSRTEEYYSCEDSGTITYIVNNLDSGTKYKFWVRAVSADEMGNQATSLMSSTVTTTTK